MASVSAYACGVFLHVCVSYTYIIHFYFHLFYFILTQFKNYSGIYVKGNIYQMLKTN